MKRTYQPNNRKMKKLMVFSQEKMVKFYQAVEKKVEKF